MEALPSFVRDARSVTACLHVPFLPPFPGSVITRLSNRNGRRADQGVIPSSSRMKYVERCSWRLSAAPAGAVCFCLRWPGRLSPANLRQPFRLLPAHALPTIRLQTGKRVHKSIFSSAGLQESSSNGCRNWARTVARNQPGGLREISRG